MSINLTRKLLLIQILRNMSKNTIYLRACKQVSGFQAIGEEFIRKLVIDNKARSTHENYLCQMSKLALHYGKTPLELKDLELEEYFKT